MPSLSKSQASTRLALPISPAEFWDLHLFIGRIFTCCLALWARDEAGETPTEGDGDEDVRPGKGDEGDHEYGAVHVEAGAKEVGDEAGDAETAH